MKRMNFFRTRGGKRYLRDYIRLVIGFYACLLVLAVYQQVRLYGQGVLDSVFSSNLLLLFIHHLGFAALVGLLVSFLFSGLERWKSGLGFRASLTLFFMLLLSELVLTEYFLDRYILPGASWSVAFSGVGNTSQLLVLLVVGGIVLATAYRFFYRLSKRIYRIIARMYPTTVVLVSVFLATLLSEKKPVNLNKNQDVFASIYTEWTQQEPYSGSEAYPLWKNWTYGDPLGPYLNWGESPPNIMLIAVEGLNGAFLGNQAPYSAFVPFLDSLKSASLYWPDYLANNPDPEDAMPVLIGSLPQGSDGFIYGEELSNRLSLYSLLKKNGYRTSFQYGGNAAITQWDRLLYAERVDEISDRKAFGSDFELQEKDAAGISLGYPDHALFTRHLETRVSGAQPVFDYFQTLSSREPYAFPKKEQYLQLVDSLISELPLDSREKRVLKKNREFAAALRYADDALAAFLSAFREQEAYSNTLIIITGTHHPRELATPGILNARRVPLLISGPMLIEPRTIPVLASHADLAPSLLASLQQRYNFELPQQAAWMGESLVEKTSQANSKPVPLYQGRGQAAQWVSGNMLIAGNSAYRILPGLDTEEVEDPVTFNRLMGLSREWNAIDRYTVDQNALIPPEAAPFEVLIAPPSKQELVWIHSVFNGKDFDQAYAKARQLALNGDRERAELLCRYILSRVPGHVDTEILMGRMYAWSLQYERAENILEQVIQKHPIYEDGYAALLDVYYWSGNQQKARFLMPAIQQHLNPSDRMLQKMKRAGIAPDPETAELPDSKQHISQTLFK